MSKPKRTDRPKEVKRILRRGRDARGLVTPEARATARKWLRKHAV